VYKRQSYRFVVTTGSGPRSDVALDNVIFSAESRFPLSTTDVAKTIQYAISPNPSDGNFYLNTTQHLKSIQVINSFGQTVLNNTMIDHHAKLIDMKGNAPGIYIVILCNENNEYSRLKISLF